MAVKKKKEKSFSSFLNNPIDFTLVITILLLLSLGLVMLLSASSPSALSESGNSYSYFSKQLIFAVLGLIAMMFISKIDYRFYQKFYKHAWWISLLLLALVLIAGRTINGAKRWIYVTETLSIQPSELVKILMIIFYAGILVKNRDELGLFGKGFLSVQSDSMTRSGTLPSEYDFYEIQGFAKGDLLYVSVINNKNINDLKKGDVVTFYDSTIEALNTHRIVYITYNEDNTVNSVSLQGDKSASEWGVFDPTDDTKLDLNYQLQSRNDIATFSGDGLENLKGVVTGVNVGAGKVLDNIQKNWLWYFVLPVLVFLLFEVFLVVRNIMDLKGAKQSAKLLSDKEAMMADLEAQKEEMRKQILAELEQAQLEKSKKEDSDSSKDVNE